MWVRQVPTEGFTPVEGEPIDEAPLTIGVSCLMSYEHTGDPDDSNAFLCLAVFWDAGLSSCAHFFASNRFAAISVMQLIVTNV